MTPFTHLFIYSNTNYSLENLFTILILGIYYI